jgi:hypothetical protein
MREAISGHQWQSRSSQGPLGKMRLRRRTMSNGSFAHPQGAISIQSSFNQHAINMQSACNQATHREQRLFRVPPRCNLSVEDAARRSDAQ